MCFGVGIGIGMLFAHLASSKLTLLTFKLTYSVKV